MRLNIDTEFEPEGDRWIAEVIELPGVMLYGPTEAEAMELVAELAIRVLTERLEPGQETPAVTFKHVADLGGHIRLTPEGFETLRREMENPSPPSEKLRKLIRGLKKVERP